MICQFNDLKNKYYRKNPYNILSKKAHINTNTGLKLGRQLNSFNEKKVSNPLKLITPLLFRKKDRQKIY